MSQEITELTLLNLPKRKETITKIDETRLKVETNKANELRRLGQKLKTMLE